MRPHFQLAISSFLPATLSDSATVNSHRMRGIHCEDEPAKVRIQNHYERTNQTIENKCDGIWSPSIFMKKNEVPLFTQYIHEGKWVKADSRRKFVGDPTDFPTDLHEKASPNPAWRLLAVSGREIGMGM